MNGFFQELMQDPHYAHNTLMGLKDKEILIKIQLKPKLDFSIYMHKFVQVPSPYHLLALFTQINSTSFQKSSTQYLFKVHSQPGLHCFQCTYSVSLLTVYLPHGTLLHLISLAQYHRKQKFQNIRSDEKHFYSTLINIKLCGSLVL